MKLKTKQAIDKINTAASSLQEFLDGVWEGQEGLEAIIHSLQEAADLLQDPVPASPLSQPLTDWDPNYPD